MTQTRHPCRPHQTIGCVLVDEAAHRAHCHRAAFADAVEAPVEAVLIRPACCRNGADPVVLQPCGEQLVPVVVPVLDGRGEVGVKREVRAEHQRAFCQRIEIPLRLPPEALELVIVEEEVHACVLRVPACQQLVEADQVINPKG